MLFHIIISVVYILLQIWKRRLRMECDASFVTANEFPFSVEKGEWSCPSCDKVYECEIPCDCKEKSVPSVDSLKQDLNVCKLECDCALSGTVICGHNNPAKKYFKPKPKKSVAPLPPLRRNMSAQTEDTYSPEYKYRWCWIKIPYTVNGLDLVGGQTEYEGFEIVKESELYYKDFRTCLTEGLASNMLNSPHYINYLVVRERSLLEAAVSNLETRLATFKSWPFCMGQSKYDLASNGFIYTNVGDIVQCAFCSLRLKDGEPRDDVMTEHKKFSKNCSFIASLGC